MQNGKKIIWAFFWGSFFLLQVVKSYELVDRLWILVAYYAFGINIVNFFLGGVMRTTGEDMSGNSNFFRRLFALALSVIGFSFLIGKYAFGNMQ